MQFLARSLGGKASLRKSSRVCKNNGVRGEYFFVQINTKINSELFTLKKKKDRVTVGFNGGVSELGRRVVSIELVRREQAQCIRVADNSSLYITNDFIVTHNTWLGCESRLVRAIAYPGYKSFIGRNELTRLMATAYITFQKVCKHHNISIDEWNLNGKYNYIEFRNGSRIDLLDLAHRPTDPMYERLGSLEYTDGGWIEEAGEVPFMAVDILRSRGGRHMNKEFNLSPDTLYTYNPNKGWVYRIYKQWKEGLMVQLEK